MHGTAIINKLEVKGAELNSSSEGVVRVVLEGGDFELVGAKSYFEKDHVRITGTLRVTKEVEVKFFSTEVAYDLEPNERELKSLLDSQSKQRRRILTLMIQGFTDREIAQKLKVLPNTIQTQKRRMTEVIRRVRELTGN